MTEGLQRRNWPYRLIRSAGYLLVLVIVGTSGLLVWLLSSLPKIDGMISVPGLAAPVEIVRDTNAVPHIFAKGSEDAYFALGLCHAQDRLWQMEMMRRTGAGRLSEIMGAPTLSIDKFTRTLGFYRSAEVRAGEMPSDLRKQMDAYAAGVNYHIDNHDGPLSPEFTLLNHTPEPWRTADSLVWSRMMAFRLSQNWRKELFRLRLQTVLTKSQIDDFWPSNNLGPITLGNPSQAASLLKAVPPTFRPKSASNAWVLSGKRTASGKPILANDPHLGFNAPGLWYLARIKTPKFEITGATVPGVPITVIGHNGTIAWGLTTTGGDSQDLFIEKIDPKDKNRYLAPNGPRAFHVRTEIIKVKGTDSVTLHVRTTRNGPVISDISTPAQRVKIAGQLLALKSIAARADDRTHEALYRINRAKDWKEFLAATKLFHSPQQNLFYADVTGDIGMIAPARLPLRNGWDGRWPADGTNRNHRWIGFIPYDGLPKRYNPSVGFIGNANNQLVPNSYPYLISKDWDAPYRARRLKALAAGNSEHTLDDSAAWQMDHTSEAARELLPLMLQQLQERETKALKRLIAWDYQMDKDKPEPLLYSAWVRFFMIELMKPYGLRDLAPMPAFLVKVLRDKPNWCDHPTTNKRESCKPLLAASLRKAIKKLSQYLGKNIGDWKWGEMHRATFKHRLFDRIPIIKLWGNLSIPTDGGDHTLNRGQTTFGDDGLNPFSHRHGAGFRVIYDLGDLQKSRFIIATGQSGNIFSKYYGNFLQPWRDGRYIHVFGEPNRIRKRALGALLLVPTKLAGKR